MPYARRFYYLPKDNSRDTDILIPGERLWGLEGACLDALQDNKSCGTSQKSFTDLPIEVQKKQAEYKSMLGILNRMTTRKFYNLMLLMKPECMAKSQIEALAEIIFSKTLADELYVHVYAQLSEEIFSVVSSDLCQCFSERLKHLCLTTYDHLLALSDHDISSIHEDKRYVFKKRLMNMMRFMGETYCLSHPLFSKDSTWDMLERLIAKGDDLHLEAVYSFLRTISLRGSDNSWPESIWSTVARVARGCSFNGVPVTSRMRFLFLSLVEARVGVLSPDRSLTPSSSDSESNHQVCDYKGF